MPPPSPLDHGGSVAGPAPGAESGWAAASPPVSPPPSVPSGLRYALGGLVGHGGMGHVLVAHDQVLDRDVAYKIVRPDHAHDPAATARLAHEARLTAALDHPAIVPVHDAGLGPDGAPFYVMRLVRGRSLAEEIAARPGLDARLALLRPVLTVCEAVAWAHHRGVVHRDLKPHNVMLGEFGEVQVMDWGLAAPVGAHDAGPVGTVPYMSPEQAAGEPASARGDVYSLGVLLLEVVTGRVPDPASISALSGAPLQPPAHAPPAAALTERPPPELYAVIRRCLAAEPETRYTARELADDLARFLDGRRVAAHDYSTAALLKRVLRAWRVPLTVAAVALVALITVVALGTARVAAERDRAEAALASSLAAQAAALFDVDALPEAEALARQALAHLPAAGTSNPTRADAVGLLLADYARPELVATSPLPLACEVPRLAPGRGDLLLCLGGGRARLHRLDPVAGWSLAWEVATSASVGHILTDARAVAVVDPHERLHLLALADGAPLRAPAAWHTVRFAATRRLVVTFNPSLVALTDPGAATVASPRLIASPCAAGRLQALATDPEETLAAAACTDGPIVLLALAGSPPAVTIGRADGVGVSAVALGGADETGARLLAWGDPRGGLGVTRVDRAGVAVHDWARVLPAAVVGLTITDAAIVATLEAGRVRVISFDGDDLAALPARTAIAGLGIDAAERLVALGDGVATVWQPPSAWRPHRLDLAPGLGLTGATPSPGGERVAASTADGRVIIARRDGTRAAPPTPHAQLVKALAWSLDGAAVYGTWMGDVALWRVAVAEGAPPPWRFGAASFRRVAVLAGGLILGVAYDTRSTLYTAAGAPLVVPELAEAVFVDVGVSSSHEHALLVAQAAPRALVLSVAPSGAVTARTVALGLASHAGDIAEDGRAAVVARADTVALVDLETGAERALEATAGRALSVAFTPDARRVAAGTDSGEVVVWDVASGVLLARVRGHRERVVRVDPTPDGRALVSASWDGTARFWDLTRLDGH